MWLRGKIPGEIVDYVDSEHIKVTYLVGQPHNLSPEGAKHGVFAEWVTETSLEKREPFDSEVEDMKDEEFRGRSR